MLYATPEGHTPPAVTVPVMAGKLGVSLHELTAVLAARPELAARVFVAGRSRMLETALIPELRAALDSRAAGRRLLT